MRKSEGPERPRQPPAAKSGATAHKYQLWSPCEGLPAFRLRLDPRRPDQTDAMHEACRRDAEQGVRIQSVMLSTCQRLATEHGNHLRCVIGQCRRLGECIGRRDEDTAPMNYEMFPPCIPDDHAVINQWWEATRKRINYLIAEAKAANQAAGVSCPPSIGGEVVRSAAKRPQANR